MKRTRIGVLASTRGTDLQAVIDEAEARRLDADVSVVISDNKDAYALERARAHGIEAVFVDPAGKTKQQLDDEIMSILDEKGVDLVLLIGYKRFLGKRFVERYRDRIMNIHPSLLPAFPGWDKSVHEAVLEHGVKVTGCTLHFVDESRDAGPIILQRPVQVEEGDTPDSLKARVQEAEKQVILEAIRLFQEGRLRVEGRRVRVLGK